LKFETVLDFVDGAVLDTPNASTSAQTQEWQNPFQFSGDTVEIKDRRIFHLFNDVL
jgi:hypothetical protein